MTIYGERSRTMKKNRINLLVNRDDYQKYENLFERLKLITAILAVILTVIFTYFYISIKNKFSIYEKMNLEKKTYLQLITSRKEDETKVNYIQKKYFIAARLGNKDLLTQLAIFVNIYKEEMYKRYHNKTKQQFDGDLDQLINVD